MWNRTEDQITLVMLRHGATRANREHRYLGKTDEPLLEETQSQLSMCRSLRSYPEVDGLFISPMKRCMQTADILYPNLQPVRIPEWEEMDFGIFEGRNYMELQGDDRYQAWIDSNGILPFPEGESREDFRMRCEKGFRRMLEVIDAGMDHPKTVGMIVHGGTIMALLSRYCGGDYFDYQAANGQGYLCTVSGRGDSVSVTIVREIGNGMEKNITGVME
ncbi:MAG: histidine phosphatase family protein [Lachnospiraceae bacterium]|nr:histidine phosphatase family protein [Lachnospiraceae bacterium]